VIVDVKVPVFSESIHEGTLLEWKKKAGERVSSDDVLVEIETDKVVLEVPAPEGGVLKKVLRQAGETVHSEDLIAQVDTVDVASITSQRPGETTGEVQSPKTAEESAPPSPTASIRAEEALSPAVRKLVLEHELEPTTITGTGRGGRITKEDVLAHLETREPTSPKPELGDSAVPTEVEIKRPVAAQAGERNERREPMSRIRARIAERLVEAQRTAAILTTFNEINVFPVMQLRHRHQDRFEKRHGVRLGIMSFFAKATVLALKQYPIVNASIDGEHVVYHDYYDLGIAVGSSRGLVVPVLRAVDRCSFAGIERQIAQFAEKAADGQLTVEELSGGTFTITNGGVFGSLLSTPILNPPQSAILGMHKFQERPVVEQGEILVRPMMYVALSYDHRLIDGREAVQFLIAIKESLENPEQMLFEV
jgi:2-oxoglutarate dehydrogenase E2 component (dihydrolipoamide succinyltransferase)